MNPKWEKYQGALLPNIAPHCEPKNTERLPTLLKERKALFARYTTDFDCGYTTEWWYCIKDSPMDLRSLRSKERSIINKGLRLIEIVRINPTGYKNEIFSVMIKCFEEYPDMYRPKVQFEIVSKDLEGCAHDKNTEYWGCFDRASGNFCGYAVCQLKVGWVALSSVKVDPAYLSKQVNAALGYTICMEYLNGRGIKYVSDGERNIRHQTNYQEYLIKYFGFRKAYCKLHVVYRPAMGIAVKMLYPFRKIIKKIAHTPLLYNASCILDQERICRLSREQKV